MLSGTDHQLDRIPSGFYQIFTTNNPGLAQIQNIYHLPLFVPNEPFTVPILFAPINSQIKSSEFMIQKNTFENRNYEEI